MGIDVDGWLGSLEGNAARLGEAARKAGLDARVATCPKWAVSDLVVHIGSVYRWVDGLLASAAQERPAWPAAPGTDDLLGWYDEGAQRLVATLRGTDPDATVWTFAGEGPGPARWWARRMAHEATIHRVDAESATGGITPVVPPEMAADGLDELFDLLPVRHARSDEMQAIEGNFHFHTTDVPGEWVVSFADRTVEVRREHAKCAVAVRGPASDLLLFTYNRTPGDDVEILGDQGLAETWRAAVRF